MSEPILNAEARAKINEVKVLWSNSSRYEKIRAIIRFPFIVIRNLVRDILRKF